MAITLGLVEAVDDNGVYVSMPGTRGVLRGPYRCLDDVAVGSAALVLQTDGGENVVAGAAGYPGRTGVHHVRDYGAVGDGATDDTAAIQAAFSAAEGSVVLMSPGTYRVTSGVQLAEATTLYGYGATLTCAKGSGTGILKMDDGVRIYGLTVENTHATGGSWGISTESSSDLTIADCTIRGTWLVGVTIDYGSSVRVTGNVFDTVGRADGSSTPGTACAMLGTKDVIVSGNTFTECKQDAVYVATSTDVTVTGNTIRDQPEGVQVRVSCANVTVSNNTFVIKGSSVVSSFGIIVQTQSVNTTIVGNVFSTTSGTGTPSAAVRVDDRSHRTVISGNTFTGLYSYGVHVGTSGGGGTESLGTVVADNQFYDPPSRAIGVGANENRCLISNNHVEGGDDRAIQVSADRCTITGNSVSANVGFHGFTIDGDFNTVTGNSANDVVNGAGFLISGTDNAVTGNVATGNQTYGIEESGDRNVIVGNNCGTNDSGTADILWPGGTDTVIANNIGRVSP